jgi:hypothetical protein
MIDPAIALVAIGATGLTPSAAILALRDRDARRWSTQLVAYRLEVSSNFAPAELEQFLGTSTGLLPSRWERAVSVRGIGIEVVSTPTGIAHYLLVPQHQQDIVLGQLRGSVPSARVTPQPDYRPLGSTLAGELATPHPTRQLSVDRPESVASGILASLQPLNQGEQMIVQWLLFPVARSSSSSPAGLADAVMGALFPKVDRTDTKPPKDVVEKQRLPQFAAVARLGVTSVSPARDRQLLGRLTAGFHGSNSADATLRRRNVSSRQVVRSLSTRRSPALSHPCHLNSAELAGLVALPSGDISLPGLSTTGCRQRAPHSDIPTTGRIIADSTFPGLTRPMALSVVASQQHVHYLGPSGSGKTVGMGGVTIQDMEAGHCVIVVDPKRDLIEDLLDRVPRHRQSDVIVLDPLDDRPVGLNVLQSSEDPDLVAEQVFSIIHKLNRDSWGPRLSDLLRVALHTLARTEGATLCELPVLLTDATWRAKIIGGLDDPIGLGAVWAQFDSWSESERSAAISPILNKVRPWVVQARMRHVLGQAQPLLDIDDVLAKGRILFVPLSAGELGADAAALLGAVVLAKISQAIMRRVRLPKSERRPVFLFIDEAQLLGTLPTPIAELLATARAMGVSVTLANQTLSQFDTELREAVLGTTRSHVIFQLAATDAARMAKEVSPHLGAEDLRGLGPYEVVATLATGGRVAPPATGRTRPLPPGNGQSAAVKELSRQRWGRDRTEVEAELRRRQERPTGTGTVGRQRRST